MVLVTIGVVFPFVAAWFGHWKSKQTGIGVISMVAEVLAKKCCSDDFSFEFASSRSSQSEAWLLLKTK